MEFLNSTLKKDLLQANNNNLKEGESMTIKERFDKECISIRRWALKHNLNERVAYKVINGEFKGERDIKGVSKKVFEALKKDGFINSLPKGLKKAS